MPQLLNPLLASSRALDDATCAPLLSDYSQMKSTACNKGLNALSRVAAAFVFIAIVSVATIWISIVLTKRIMRPRMHDTTACLPHADGLLGLCLQWRVCSDCRWCRRT